MTSLRPVPLSSRHRRLPALVALAALAVPGLVACSGEDIGAGLAERAIEGAGGGDVDIDVDGEEMTITGDDGTVVSSSTRLPDDFPDDIPLVDEEVVSSVSAGGVDGGGWAISMVSDRSADDVLDDAVGRLEAAGFTRDDQASMSAGGMSMVQVTDGTWQVSVTVIDSDGTSLQYLVSAPTT